ncbi:MAG: DUF1722 domain-containing protein [Deltaproteobacteria bacterium]|nr:DUF1722 domain-containing protein [Deltaproteobacteria bacterium]
MVSAIASGGTAGDDRPLRLGVSSCLLGAEVRFDGGHKRDRFLTDLLGRFVEWVPVCPELEVGMGVPREAVRLVGDPAAPRMVGTRSGTDHTDAMRRYAATRVRALAALDLSGYVLKKDSPSCGMERVRVYETGGMPSRRGRGIFAAVFMAAYPSIPVEEEGRLDDPLLRENFIERLFCYRRWRALLDAAPTRGALVAFHSAHKFLVLAHSPRDYAALGRLLGDSRGIHAALLARRYGERLMAALAVPATVKKHANVLQHVAGFCRKHLTPGECRELAEVIEDYRRGLVPLIVPLTLVRHHVVCHDVADVRGQTYLNPHPQELMLRNHV